MKVVEQLEKERERERLKLTGGGPKVNFIYHAKPVGQEKRDVNFNYNLFIDVGWF